MAQSIIESSQNGVPGQSAIARDKNNFHGIGAFDSDPYNKALTYSDAANGWVGYFDNIARTSVYRNNGVFDTNSPYGNAVTNPYAYLQAIAAAGYASSQSYIASNSVVINSVIKLAEEQGWAISSQLATSHPEMLANASIIGSTNQLPYERSGSGTLSSPFSFNYIGLEGNGADNSGGILSSSACELGSGNGNLNATALQLAWPNLWDSRGGPSKPHYCTPTTAFITAAKEVGTWDEYTKGCSCDRFVATVIRYSGVDPNVPKGATGEQLNYFRNHPELYQEVPNTGNTANLLPGDIFVKNGHIMMYVQREDGTEGIAEASISYSNTGYEGRAGEVVPINWESRNGYYIFRYIGGR